MDEPLWEIAWLQPEEAMVYWRERVPLTREQMAGLEEAHQTRAFTVAGVTSLQYLTAIYEGIDRALAEGITLQEFDAQLLEITATRGFTGLSPHHLHLVFFNNLNQAYMAGRYRQMRHPQTLAKRPIWVYDPVNDRKTRPSHAALEGVARHADDEFWKYNYPPNGFYCRCDVITLSPEEARRLGYDIEKPLPPGATGPDDGWEQDPATAFTEWEPDLSRVPAVLRTAYEDRQNRRAG